MPKAKGNYCNVEGCHNRSEDDRGAEIHYYRLPAVIYNQGQEWENLVPSEDDCGWQHLTKILWARTWQTFEFARTIL